MFLIAIILVAYLSGVIVYARRSLAADAIRYRKAADAYVARAEKNTYHEETCPRAVAEAVAELKRETRFNRRALASALDEDGDHDYYDFDDDFYEGRYSLYYSMTCNCGKRPEQPKADIGRALAWPIVAPISGVHFLGSRAVGGGIKIYDPIKVYEDTKYLESMED